MIHSHNHSNHTRTLKKTRKTIHISSEAHKIDGKMSYKAFVYVKERERERKKEKEVYNS